MRSKRSNEQRTKYFQTSRDGKEVRKRERERIGLEAQIKITYILKAKLLLVGDGVG